MVQALWVTWNIKILCPHRAVHLVHRITMDIQYPSATLDPTVRPIPLYRAYKFIYSKPSLAKPFRGGYIKTYQWLSTQSSG